jgi:transcriptional regulator with XRE-family HTH domain
MNTIPPQGWKAANSKELGRALARARQKSGLNQEVMASRLGVDRAYVARMETGLSTEQLRRTFAFLRETGMELAIVPKDSDG